MNYTERYEFWLNAGLPTEIQEELRSIAQDQEELKSRFASELEFGTAGMRGIMGAGSNRLNRYTVRRAAQGMAAWLASTDLPKKAAIGYDSRHNSQLFAEVCAVAFAEAGIETYLYDRLAPTPMLSFAVRELGCGCGIVISASHNSGEYNGVKCYGPDGCQMTDEPAAIVTENISKIPYFVPETKSFQAFMEEGLIHYIGQSLWEAYYNIVLAEAVEPEMLRSSGLNIVYTPLCGTGNEPVREVLGRLGVNITVVECQEQPDGDFKTCEYPNPETDAALNESYKVAQNVPCDVILGTDPDADRVAIAVPDGKGGFVKLSGNELGFMLLDYVLKARTAKNDIPEGAITVRSIVSSPLADRIAEHYGVTMKAVLTGFKYIGEQIRALEEVGQEERFLLGYEESYGYLTCPSVRDKDAVNASLLICEMVAWYKAKGQTLVDGLNAIYEKFGFYTDKVMNFTFEGAEGFHTMQNLMAALRTDPVTEAAGFAVESAVDYKNDDTGLPKSNVLQFQTESSKILVRPSGTEPKVKVYLSSRAATMAEAAAKNASILEAVTAAYLA